MSLLETVDLQAVSFDPARILTVLGRSGAEIVVIGGVAATLHGSPVATADADAVAARTESNLQRLGDSLRQLEAAVLVSISVDDRTATVVRQEIDAATLENLSPARLLTRHGVVDVMWQDATVGDYDDWRADAVQVSIAGTTIQVASLESLIRSKERADRDKDRAALPFLRALLRRSEE